MGHVFVLRGDILRLACDAWMLSADESLFVDESWLRGPADALAASDPRLAVRAWFAPVPGGWVADPGRFDVPKRWNRAGRRVARFAEWPAEAPRPYLANVGGGRTTPPEWYLDAVDEFVATARADLGGTASRSRVPRAKPLLAVPAVGTGHGGGARRKATMIRALLDRLHVLAREHDVDIALVTYSEGAYATAQAIRREGDVVDRWTDRNGDVVDRWTDGSLAALPPATGCWSALAESPGLARALPTLRSLARRASRGELVLFLGAGVSMAAGLPGWRELLDELAVGAGLADELEALRTLDPLDRARIIEEHAGGRDALRLRIATRLDRPHHAVAHSLLAALPVREVITQNYDSLFELASEPIERATVLPGAHRPEGARWLLKMHGCIRSPGEIVLTREDYLRYGDRRSALAGIVQALLLTRHMLFAGFSLDDPNFHRIVDDVRKAVHPVGGGAECSSREPFGTALLLQPDRMRQQLWRDDLAFCAVHDDAGDVARAARAFEIALDYLAYRATTSAAYLLDPDFAHALGEDEIELRDALAAIASRRERFAHSPAWPHVEALLARLGMQGRKRGD
jgi:hypothetical protein